MTAMGRRRQLFSPVPEMSGNAIKNANANNRSEKQQGMSPARRQQRQRGERPKKEEVRPGHCLHDGRVWLAFRTEWARKRPRTKPGQE